MTYLVAAYGITIGSLVAYAVGMLRERGRLKNLRSDLTSGGTGGRSENTPENSRIK